VNDEPTRVHWRSLALDPDCVLGSSARLAVCALAEEMGRAECFVGMATIAARMRVSDRKARQAVRELERVGFLVVQQRAGITSLYRRALPLESPRKETTGVPRNEPRNERRNEPPSIRSAETDRQKDRTAAAAAEEESAELLDALRPLEQIDGYPLDGRGREKVRRAFDEDPDGIRALIHRYVQRERTGGVKSASGAFVRAIERGEHRNAGARRRRNAACPECGTGGALHAADCSRANDAAASGREEHP
jgi:hypothetical protein